MTVELLDAAGNPTGITTTTGANGSYSFGDLVAGTYGVKFTDDSGKLLTTQNVDGDASDDIDSDASDLGNGMSEITGITVNSGENTPDNDAGVVEPLGSLSGTYFCDDNEDGLDNDADNGVLGVTVELLDENGDPTGITTTTADDGSYSFGNLVPGSYGVKFTDDSGKVLTTQNVDGDASDDIDSDAADIGGGMSQITGITVTSGENTPNNDAGAFVPKGSLSGKYFCDENEDGLDNEADNGLKSVTVELLDAAGNPTGATTTTDEDGFYSFGDLVPGSYGVKFTDDSGKVLTTQNVDGDASDDIDSDASDLGNGMSQITGIVVVSGTNTPDNDAGAYEPNEAPVAGDDAYGKSCADKPLTLDVLDNDSDAEGPVTITAVDGKAFGDDGSVVLDNGVTVTLVDGKLDVDYSTSPAVVAIGVGTELPWSFNYTIEDSEGASATAQVDLTVCGAFETAEEWAATLPTDVVKYEITDPLRFSSLDRDEMYTLNLTDAGDFDGVFAKAYCVAVDAPLETAEAFDGKAQIEGTLVYATAASAAAISGTYTNIKGEEYNVLKGIGCDGDAAVDNIDEITWILNQDWTMMDNGEGESYTDEEVQYAIWCLTDNATSGASGKVLQNAGEIAALASVEGEGFEAGAGDLAGVFVVPTQDEIDAGNTQPMIIAMEIPDCIC